MEEAIAVDGDPEAIARAGLAEDTCLALCAYLRRDFVGWLDHSTLEAMLKSLDEQGSGRYTMPHIIWTICYVSKLHHDVGDEEGPPGAARQSIDTVGVAT